MIRPDYLSKGDKVALIAPARKIEKKELINFTRIFKEFGFRIKEGRNLFATHDQFAGTDSQRFKDLQDAMDDPEIKAIFCVRGGYGTVRTVQDIDFTGFMKHPKWVAGFSDISVLHNLLHLHNFESLHCMMPVNFNSDYSSGSSQSVFRAVTGNNLSYQLENHPFNRVGETNGLLSGGNLSVLFSLRGTPLEVNYENKILFIEDVDEYLYHLDRMMMNLKISRILRKISGLIVGGMTDFNDNQVPYGKSPYEIIASSVEEYNYPVIFNFPAGHQKENMCLIMGREIKMEVNDSISSVFFT